jgi:anti-anti-sigma factor
MSQTDANTPNERVVVTVEHDLVGPLADEFRNELRETTSDDRVDLAIDFANVTAIDGRGLAVIAQCYNTVTAQGGTFTVITDNAEWKDLFETCRLGDQVDIRESL